MLPNKIRKNIITYPKTRNEHDAIEKLKELQSIGYDDQTLKSMVISQEDAMLTMKEMNISEDTAFYEFYLNGFKELNYNIEDDLLYGLDEIYENYKNPFYLWKKYPQIGKRYLQLSSIEGEWSYFYDKETDAVYGVDWGEMDDFMAGKLKPLLTSFYDFLEWYYSKEDE